MLIRQVKRKIQKQVKEQSINDKISSRFEQELKSFSDGLARKGTTKKLEKVWERIGRLKEKYRLVTGRYAIDVISSGRLPSEIVWQNKSQQHATDQDKNGVYFIRTNINKANETMLWAIYNTVREVESSFRCLKTFQTYKGSFGNIPGNKLKFNDFRLKKICSVTLIS